MPTERELEAGREIFDRVILLNNTIASDMLFEVEIETLVAAILVAAELERDREAIENVKRMKRKKKHGAAV